MTSLCSVQAVTFDVGGTLLAAWPSVGHVYAEVASFHGMPDLSPELLNRQFAAAWQALKEFNHTRAEWTGLVQATFQGLAQAKPAPTFFSDLYARFGEPGAWRVFEDVVPTLDELASRGLKLGVISNWDERLRPLLRELKLSDYFETIIVSHEVGFPKPSPVIFQHAAEKLALPPEAILHVGDSVEMDARGARAAGLRALELRRGADGVSPDQINSLRTLEALPPAPAVGQASRPRCLLT